MYTKLIRALLISTVLISCHKNEKSYSATPDLILESPPQSNKQPVADKKIPVANKINSDADTAINYTTATNNDWSKKIIKEASLKIEVKNFKNYNSFLYSKVKQYGSYISQENNNLTDEKSETVATIKVPVQFFDGLINDLTSTDDKLLEKNIKSDDVTDDIVDTKARLEAKKQMRIKYLDFLKASKNMSEVLEVQAEINNIQEEIESASSRYASLSNQSAYSTITLTFYQPSVGFVPGNDSPSFFSKTLNAFKAGAAWVSELFIALISIWPLILLIIIGFIFFKKRRPQKLIQQNV